MYSDIHAARHAQQKTVTEEESEAGECRGGAGISSILRRGAVI